MENALLFESVSSTLFNMKNSIEGPEKIWLFENNEELSFAENVDIIVNPFSIDFSSRKIFNAIISQLRNTINLDEELKSSCEKHSHMLSNCFSQALQDIGIDFSWNTQWDLAKYSKYINLHIDESVYTNCLERIMGYIDIVSELKLFKLIIFYNIKAYFSLEQLKELYKYIMYKKITVLLLESHKSDFIDGEYKFVVDKEYDEYVQY